MVINDLNRIKRDVSKTILPSFKYWLRINGYHLIQFGQGEKWNPIKLKTRNNHGNKKRNR